MIKLLDCTLRDGGYYNDWDFSSVLIHDYLDAMSALRVEYVEVGLRSLINNKFKGACAYSSDEFISGLSIPEYLSDKIGVMINGSELITEDPGALGINISEFQRSFLEKLFSHKSTSPVSLVRIACHIHEFEKCLVASLWLKDKGYKVGFNLMQIANCSEAEIESLAFSASKYPIDVLYFADSMGSLGPDQITKIVKGLKKAWKGEIGIHTHDNMGQALANSIRAVDEGVVWVDGTVTGMGRGPGNVQTEYLAIALNKHRDKKSKSTKLLEVINKHFMPLQNKYGWGTNPYYYLAGMHGIHPSFVQEMLSDSRFNEEDILSVIEHLRIQGGNKFSINALESARKFYIGAVGGDWDPFESISGRNVLIIGTGPGVIKYKKEIESYISKFSPFVMALNAQKSISDHFIDVRVACHPVRILADTEEHLEFSQPLIIPYSMLPNELREELSGKEVLDFGISVSEDGFSFNTTHCRIPKSLVIAYALAIASSGKAKQVVLAGFDGYGADDPRRKEMDDLFNIYRCSNGSLPITSITPSNYDINIKSIFSLTDDL